MGSLRLLGTVGRVPYPRRPDIPGLTHHVVSKGTNGEPIFFDHIDREAFVFRLELVAEKYNWRILAHCLLGTHYHLVIRVPDGGLSAGMQELNRGYSWRTNQRYGRQMHLFRQRFWSAEIETESHLLEATRYTVLNPVKAGLCELPEEWLWSSYRATAGLSSPPPFLAAQELLATFDLDPARSRRRYVEFVRAGLVRVSETVVVARAR